MRFSRLRMIGEANLNNLINLIKSWFRQFLLVIALCSVPSIAAAQHVHLRGTVRERGSGDAIPGASLAIMGTSRGAKANVEG